MSVDHGTPDLGGAPVIELTLSPSVMFNGPQGAQSAASAPAAQAQPKTALPTTRPADKASANPTEAIQPPAVDLPILRQPQPKPHVAVAPTATLKSATTSPAHSSAAPSSSDQVAQSRSTGTAKSHGQGRGTQASTPGLSQGHGAASLGGSGQSGLDAYEATVIGWIERHKSHPGGPNGAAMIGFTLDRRGNLRASRILQSSGVNALDRISIDQLKAASPFPRPPHGTTWQTRDFRVRMDYQAASR